MPTTNLAIITEAFQKIGVIDENSAPSAEQTAQAFTILNDGLNNEGADGLRLGWYTQTNVAATAPIRDADIYGVKLWLCERLSAHYGITIQNPVLLNEIQEAVRQLVKRSIQYFEADFSELSRPQGGPWGGPNWI
jgi:hypothetical protein